MHVRTHNLRWVKKHCRLIETESYGLAWEHKNNEPYLFSPRMDTEVCGKLFTLEIIRGAGVSVKETSYIIPMWMLTWRSLREVRKHGNDTI